MNATPQRTPAEFEVFAQSIAPAAKAVFMAQAYAELKREEVDAYIAPVFARYTFHVRPEWAERHGELVTKPKDLYLTTEDEADLLQSYYEDCDAAHRAHGFTGPKGHCPALVAEHLLTTTEQAFIELAAPWFGIAPDWLYGQHREKFLDLMLRACAKFVDGRI